MVGRDALYLHLHNVRSEVRMKINFYGVRGSVPAPLVGADVHTKLMRVIKDLAQERPSLESDEAIEEWLLRQEFEHRSTYGGNTTCVEVRCGDTPIILDMGTGMRVLGNAMMPQIMANKGVSGIILQSHLHWDHIQGFPFWGPIYLPRTNFDNRFVFYGGKSWEAQLETVLAGQMNAPVFPVNFRELALSNMQMNFRTIHSGWSVTEELHGKPLKLTARKLHHPQETFGYRIEYDGHVVAFTTDHEPYAAGIPHDLLALVRDADVWITDCQYTHEIYTGEKGFVQRLGWGHSFPEYIANVGKATKPGHIITTHHDPMANDHDITTIAKHVAALSGIRTTAAYEGYTLAF